MPRIRNMPLSQDDSIALDRAKILHQSWSARFQYQIATAELLHAESIALGEESELGIWLNTEGKIRFKHRAGFAALVRAHYKFHANAALVVRAIAANATKESAATLPSLKKYLVSSNGVIEAIARLKCQHSRSHGDGHR